MNYIAAIALWLAMQQAPNCISQKVADWMYAHYPIAEVADVCKPQEAPNTVCWSEDGGPLKCFPIRDMHTNPLTFVCPSYGCTNEPMPQLPTIITTIPPTSDSKGIVLTPQSPEPLNIYVDGCKDTVLHLGVADPHEPAPEIDSETRELIKLCDEAAALDPGLKCDHEEIISAMQHPGGVPMPGELQPKKFDFDVPAVQHHCFHTEHLTRWCRADDTGYHDRHPDGWLCEDWDRILLTDEGGEHHCIKFPK